MTDSFDARLADAAQQIAEGATGHTPTHTPTHKGGGAILNSPPPVLATPRLEAEGSGSSDDSKPLSPGARMRNSSHAMLVG